MISILTIFCNKVLNYQYLLDNNASKVKSSMNNMTACVKTHDNTLYNSPIKMLF